MIKATEKSDGWDGQERRSSSRHDDETYANRLFRKYREGGRESIAARDALVLQFRPLVQKLARHFSGPHAHMEDLIQEGFLGLMHGIEQYDPHRGVKLITYVTHHIDGHLRHFVRDRVQIIKEPAWLQELSHKVRRGIESLTQSLGREPTDSELANELNISEAEVARIKTTRSVFLVTSLEEEQEEGGPAAHVSKSSSLTGAAELPFEERVVLEDALVRLKEIEQKVLQGFYYEDLTQTEIAKQLGVSNNYVSHLLKNSARKLQQMFRSDAVREASIQFELRRRSVQEGRQSESEEAAPSVVDQATGLFTRSYFEARLEEELSRAKRHKLELSVVRVIVGRDAPTAAAIVQVADTVKASMRKSDLVARTGEYEIAAMLPHTGATREVARVRLAQRLAELKTKLPESTTFAVGTACYPEHSKSTTLMHAATPTDII